jgi:hypothetical protein
MIKPRFINGRLTGLFLAAAGEENRKKSVRKNVVYRPSPV